MPALPPCERNLCTVRSSPVLYNQYQIAVLLLYGMMHFTSDVQKQRETSPNIAIRDGDPTVTFGLVSYAVDVGFAHQIRPRSFVCTVLKHHCSFVCRFPRGALCALFDATPVRAVTTRALFGRSVRSSSVSGLGGSSGHGIILPVPASSARGARVLLSRSGTGRWCCRWFVVWVWVLLPLTRFASSLRILRTRDQKHGNTSTKTYYRRFHV